MVNFSVEQGVHEWLILFCAFLFYVAFPSIFSLENIVLKGSEVCMK